MHAHLPGGVHGGTERASWPAPPESLAASARWLEAHARRRVTIVPDGDADGLSAGALAFRTIERLGGAPEVLHPARGEHVHHPGFRERLAGTNPAALLVLDMGSRPGPILPGVPTLLVDHHHAAGFPEGATVLSSAGSEPVAPSSLLAWHLFSRAADLRDSSWLAALGTAADLGADAPLPGFSSLVRAAGRTQLAEAIALVNAANRAGPHDVATAFAVLLRAGSAREIASGRVAGVEALRAYRTQVAAEVARCSRTRPRISGRWALLPFSSPARVHPLVAVRWTRRLKGQVVIAANAGFLPGRVNFAMRSAGGEDLIALLRSLPLPEGEDVGYGHARATGGSLTFEDFDALLAAMGFGEEVRRLV